MKGACKKEIRLVETTLRPLTIRKSHDTVDDLYGILIHGIADVKTKESSVRNLTVHLWIIEMFN
ncbi:MAG: hypothetical protein BV459_01575 [Thermoplasmata archaeon M11B2D]|nr:MAG: hypothetical protein BV459_01575 [Thermoplasmata archaeon M11B2D]PNX51803.1 MAG: hypothetical protein BV458_11035 [Thermoplasmata archaeon M9B2D]